MPVEAELKRRRTSDGTLVSWNVNDDGTEPTADAELRASIGKATDAEASADGTVIGLLKKLRAQLIALTDGSQKTAVTNFPATQPVSGTVNVGNLPATQLVDVADEPGRELGKVEVKNPTTAPETGLAKDASIGTDGATPPAIAGTGVRGWLRAIYENVAGTLSADITDRATRALGKVTIDGALPADVTDRSTRILGKTEITNMIPAVETDLAKQATLSQVLEQLNDATTDTVLSVLKALEAKNVATETTLAAVLDALVSTDNTVQASTASIASGMWTTVVSLTRSSPITIVGFNADVDELLDMNYRYRLIVDDGVASTVKMSEFISSSRLSFIPLKVDVGPNHTAFVQVFHNEVTIKTFQASIAYQE